jgi:hypothetical protein
MSDTESLYTSLLESIISSKNEHIFICDLSDLTLQIIFISNNCSFRLKHLGVPDRSDGSDGTSYRLTENQTRPVAQAMGRLEYLPCGGYYTMPPILATRRVVYYARRTGVSLP